MGNIETWGHDIQEDMRIRKEAHFKLKEPMTRDELYNLMKKRWDTQKYSGFKLKKFLFIKSIEFDNYLTAHFGAEITKEIILGSKTNRLNNYVVIISMHNSKSIHSAFNKEQRKQFNKQLEELGINAKSWSVQGLYSFALEHLKKLTVGMSEVLFDKIA